MEVIFHIQSKIIPKEYGYLRTQTTLEEGLSAIRSIRKEEIPHLHARDPHELMRCLEAQNLAEVGELILTAALHRKESRGWHFRKDYPYTDNKNWLKWVTLTRREEEILINEIPVPTPRKAPSAEIMVPPGVRRQLRWPLKRLTMKSAHPAETVLPSARWMYFGTWVGFTILPTAKTA